jgi:hypothetical protein
MTRHRLQCRWRGIEIQLIKEKIMKYSTGYGYEDTSYRKPAVKKSGKKGCDGNDGGPHVYFTTRVMYYSVLTGNTFGSTSSHCIGCEKRQRSVRDIPIDEHKYFKIMRRDPKSHNWYGKYITKEQFNKLTEKN